jgi:lysophospholipase L1-like esterase
MATLKNKLFPVAAVSLSIVAALVLVEIMLRVAGIGYGNSPLESHPVLHHVHPANYTFRAYTPAAEYNSFTITYDERGLRKHNVPRLPVSDSAYRVAFMGDSFVEATQVSDRDSFIGRLMENSSESTEVWNLGVSSYSPIFYLVQWREIVEARKPTHVFVLLFGNDIRSDDEMTGQAQVSADHDVISIPGPGDDWLVRIARHSYVARLLRRVQLQIAWYLDNREKVAESDGHVIEEHDRISDRTDAYLRKLRDQVTASGAEFVLLAVPSKARLRSTKSNGSPEFADYVRDWAHQNGVTYLDLAPAFRMAARDGKKTFFDNDIHFNPTGHALVASVIRLAYPHVFAGGDYSQAMMLKP